MSRSAKARLLGVSRSTLYYRPRTHERDWALKIEIESVLRKHPSYGFRRVALALKRNKKPVQRVMKLYGIKAYRRRGKRWRKPKVPAIRYPNLLMEVIPQYQHHAWAADFTHLYWKGKDIRVATIMDIYTRRIVGLAVGTTGGTYLVTQSLESALMAYPKPTLFHSDNGVEYNAHSFRALLETLGINISRSKKSCPWENGYQESFYNTFKVDFGDPNRYTSLGELVAAIYHHVYVYNTERIHSALRMPPSVFAALHTRATLERTV